MGAGRGFYVGRNRMGLREALVAGRRAASERLQLSCSTRDGIDWCAADRASPDSRKALDLALAGRVISDAINKNNDLDGENNSAYNSDNK